MPTAAFTTLGCKVNQYETQRILDDFEKIGFTITEFNKPADVYVVNTCSVTQAAERKSRYLVRRVCRQNPQAIVVMTGCYAEMANIKQEEIDEVGLIVPNHDKLKTLQYVLESHPRFQSELRQSQPEARPVARPKSMHRTRATVKVQDGCNVFCSFCSIPYTRKVMLSRPVEEIVAEVRSRAEQGYREIVITGVLVGAYGQDGFQPIAVNELPRIDLQSNRITELSNVQGQQEVDLAKLLLTLTQVEGIERVRLSSIEPTQITDTLLEAFATEPKLCPHLHIPLQSGDSAVLAKMNRPYDREFYLERCSRAHSMIPDLAITSDIMVGFPGETRAAFENTLDVVHRVGFARAHIFRFSARPNTPAEDMLDVVSEQDKEERARELADACKETQRRFITKFMGRTLDVLVEGKTSRIVEAHEPTDAADDSQDDAASGASEVGARNATLLLSGYTSNYIRVQFTGGTHLSGTVMPVTLIEPSADGAIGSVGGAHFGPDEAPPDAVFIPLATFHAAIAPSNALIVV